MAAQSAGLLEGEMMRIGWLVLLVTTLFSAIPARAETVKQVAAAPRSQRVFDYTGVLSHDERVRLRSQLLAMGKRDVAQGTIIVLHRVEGVTIERFGQEIGNRWGVGERGKNNGFVILVALEQRKWRLQTGKGLRERISDAAAAELMREAVVPYFRKQQYARGLAAALSAIDRKASGHAAVPIEATPYSTGRTSYGTSSYPTTDYSGSTGFDVCGSFFGICTVVIFIGVLLSGARASGKSSGFWGTSCHHPQHHHHHDSWPHTPGSDPHSFPHVDTSPPPDQSWMHSPPPVDTSPPPSSGGSMDGGGGATGNW